mmetsp:Transcript_14443/g.41582  ORF Transcript_14443/g.41582 Transcript_14443/m.41582 type:complete len:488 (-) Transcript_14443:238-1701(-)
MVFVSRLTCSSVIISTALSSISPLTRPCSASASAAEYPNCVKLATARARDVRSSMSKAPSRSAVGCGPPPTTLSMCSPTTLTVLCCRGKRSSLSDSISWANSLAISALWPPLAPSLSLSRATLCPSGDAALAGASCGPCDAAFVSRGSCAVTLKAMASLTSLTRPSCSFWWLADDNAQPSTTAIRPGMGRLRHVLSRWWASRWLPLSVSPPSPDDRLLLLPPEDGAESSSDCLSNCRRAARLLREKRSRPLHWPTDRPVNTLDSSRLNSSGSREPMACMAEGKSFSSLMSIAGSASTRCFLRVLRVAKSSWSRWAAAWMARQMRASDGASEGEGEGEGLVSCLLSLARAAMSGILWMICRLILCGRFSVCHVLSHSCRFFAAFALSSAYEAPMSTRAGRSSPVSRADTSGLNTACISLVNRREYTSTDTAAANSLPDRDRADVRSLLIRLAISPVSSSRTSRLTAAMEAHTRTACEGLSEAARPSSR